MKSHPELLLSPNLIKRNFPVNISQDDLGDFEQEANTTTSPVYYNRFRNVMLSPDSVIYKNGLLVKDSLVSRDQFSYYQFKHYLKKRFFSKTVHLNNSQTYLLATDNFSDGHFHWFCEVLPRLFLIRNRTRDLVLLLPGRPYNQTIALESLSLLGIEFADILYMNDQHSYKIRNLDFVTNPSVKGLNPDLFKPIQEKLGAGRPQGKKRIYISRQKARFRKVLNEQKLTPLLRDYGFDIINGEDFSLRDQADLFSSAGTVMGIHGAGLTNAMFMHPGSNLVELRKKEGKAANVAYWHLADSLSHRYYYFNGTPDTPGPLIGKGCNLDIDLPAFERLVLNKLEYRI